LDATEGSSGGGGSGSGSGAGAAAAAAAAAAAGGSQGPMSTHVQDLLSDIESRPWMTYREDFPPILGTKYTSDVGWGCMIRSAQMLLAQTLFVGVLGRDFRVGGGSSGPFTKDPRHRQLLTLFADLPSERCPFSVHNLLRHAAEDRVRPGSWLGPSIACRALCRAVNQEQREVLQLRVYLALDCLVSKERVQETMLSSGKAWCPVLILIPLRLGTSQFNLAYVPALQRVLANPQSVGILGGKPRHSLYFIGFQGSELVGLDPHACRPADDPANPESTLKSYHCTSPRKIGFQGIDPSIALGFLCQTPEDLETFYAFSAEKSDDPRMKPLYGIGE
jgi:cysteine protease ATG4